VGEGEMTGQTGGEKRMDRMLPRGRKKRNTQGHFCNFTLPNMNFTTFSEKVSELSLLKYFRHFTPQITETHKNILIFIFNRTH